MFKKKLFLTSGIIMAIATLPAIADDVYNDDIAGQCVVGFLGGTGADNSTAPNGFMAQYTANEYTVSAGQYLAAGNIDGTQCPANSFCPGGTFTFNETDNQGATSCPDGFTLSAAGTSTQSDCYHTCTASDIENGEKLSGSPMGNVYQNGRNQCVGTCTTGYTFRAAQVGSNPFIGKESIEGTGHATLEKGGGGYGEKSASDYNLTQEGTWGVSFDYGDIIGIVSCNDISGNNDNWTWENDSSNWLRPGNEFNQSFDGHSAWCKITGYIPTGGVFQDLSATSPWVFAASGAADADAAWECAYKLQTRIAFRVAMFGALGGLPAACVANKVAITWNPGNGNASTTNQCTYDGAIKLPGTPYKRGYVFGGWQLKRKN